MAKWLVRKYDWLDARIAVAEEIEADGLEYYEGTLIFSDVHDDGQDRITVAVRARGEWFAADKIDD